MSLASISSLTPPATALVPLNRPPAPPASASSKPAPAPTPAAASPTAPSKSTSAAKPTSSGASGGSGGSDSSATDSTYTTTVAGKTYSGTVQYSDGQYVVSVPGLNGAVATGSSAQAAEDSLGNIISILA